MCRHISQMKLSLLHINCIKSRPRYPTQRPQKMGRCRGSVRLASLARFPRGVAELCPELYVRVVTVIYTEISIPLWTIRCNSSFSSCLALCSAFPPSLFSTCTCIFDVLFERNVVCVASL